MADTYPLFSPVADEPQGRDRRQIWLALAVSLALNLAGLILLQTQISWRSAPAPRQPLLVSLQLVPELQSPASETAAPTVPAESEVSEQKKAPHEKTMQPAVSAPKPVAPPEHERQERVRQLLSDRPYLSNPELGAQQEDDVPSDSRVFDPRLREKLRQARERVRPRAAPNLNTSTAADAQELISQGDKCFRRERPPGGAPDETVLFMRRCVGAQTEGERILKGLKDAMRER